MPITVVANPAVLSWTNFTVMANKIPDPNDGTLVDAVTRFKFDFPDKAPRKIVNRFKLGDPNVITITPQAQVWSGVMQTPALLSHEQFHYDVGIVTARALARQLMTLEEGNLAALKTAFLGAFHLHFDVRAGLLQSRYDKDTVHGTVARYQKIWKDEMAACLANPKATHLHGFWL
jgi:hypothetical protein